LTSIRGPEYYHLAMGQVDPVLMDGRVVLRKKSIPDGLEAEEV